MMLDRLPTIGQQTNVHGRGSRMASAADDRATDECARSRQYNGILGPAFCSVSTRLIREDHLRVTRRKKGHDQILKILKNINPVFQMFTPQKHIL